MSSKKVEPSKPEMKTYILDLMPAYGQPQRKKVVVPASWKITYSPAAQGAHLGGPNPFVLRFYEGQKEHMRALFHNVTSFRDASIVVEDEVEKAQAETLFRETPNGRKSVVVEGRMKEWRNADEPGHVSQDQAFLQLHAQGLYPQGVYPQPVNPPPYMAQPVNPPPGFSNIAPPYIDPSPR